MTKSRTDETGRGEGGKGIKKIYKITVGEEKDGENI